MKLTKINEYLRFIVLADLFINIFIYFYPPCHPLLITPPLKADNALALSVISQMSMGGGDCLVSGTKMKPKRT